MSFRGVNLWNVGFDPIHDSLAGKLEGRTSLILWSDSVPVDFANCDSSQQFDLVPFANILDTS